MARSVYWVSPPPARCDLSGTKIEAVFYDARVPRFSMFGTLCPTCFTLEKCKTGTGFGQKYEKQADGRFLKTEG